jgi:hypothetical protein
MNYSADTEMDLDWAADQMRRAKYMGTGLGDDAIRRVTATRRAELKPLPGAQRTNSSGITTTTLAVAPTSAVETSMGTLLSALANTASAEHIKGTCEELLLLLSERNQGAVHAEFVECQGVQAVIEVLRKYPGPTSLPALRILEKLARTSAREIATAGAIDGVIQVCERGGQAALVADINKSNREAPLLLEAALKTLLGLTFDDSSRQLLSRHSIVELAEALLRAQPGVERGDGRSTEAEEACKVAWQDVLCVSRRLLQRLGGTPPKATAAGREAAAQGNLDNMPAF